MLVVVIVLAVAAVFAVGALAMEGELGWMRGHKCTPYCRPGRHHYPKEERER